MRNFHVSIPTALLLLIMTSFPALAGVTYSAKITTTSPYVNLPRPDGDPRWAEAFEHWDNRSDTKRITPAIELFKALAADHPDQMETHMWLNRAYFHAAMRHRKQRDHFAKLGYEAGEKALKLAPDSIPANYWSSACRVLLREQTEAELDEIRAFNKEHGKIRELPVPKNDPMWAKAMELWDKRFTLEDTQYYDAMIARGEKVDDAALERVQKKMDGVIEILGKLEKKYPDQIEPKLWLLRAHYWKTQLALTPKNKAIHGKVAYEWGFKALEMEPNNPAANLFTASALGEYSISHSLSVVTKYARQMGKMIMVLSEENPNFFYNGFSRFLAAAISMVGKLAFTVAEFLGFPKELIERMARFCVDTQPLFLQNYYMVGTMYKSIGRKKEAVELFNTLLNSDPTLLKYHEPESRLFQLVTKVLEKEYMESD